MINPLPVETRHRILISLCLTILTTIVFWRVTVCNFVNYDDPDYVTDNQYVQMGLKVESIKWAFANLHGVRTYWHPLTWLSHMLDVQLFGINARVHHLVNLLFHTTNVLLLFLLLRRITGALHRSALVALLFAIHPLQVDSVAWVTERKNLLAGLFWILTLLAYHRYTLRPSPWRYLLTIASFAAGLMCKPVLVTLPVIMLLLDFWPLRRLQFASLALQDGLGTSGSPPEETAEMTGSDSSSLSPGAGVRAILTRPFSWLLLEKVPFFLLAGVACVITVLAHRQIGSFQITEGFSFSTRLENTFVSCARYLLTAIFPTRLAVLYPHPGKWGPLVVLPSLAVVVTVTIVVLRRIRQLPYLSVGWFWFLIVLLPTIGLIQAGIQSMADRFMYLPSIGLWLALIWGASDLAASRPRLRMIGGVAFSVWVTALSVLSWVQIGYWKNNIALWTHTTAVTSGNYLAHNNLASALYERGNLAGTMTNALEALRIKPDYAEARSQVANVLYDRGQTNEAIAAYLETERLNSGWAAIPFHLAKIFASQKDLHRSAAEYRKALGISPDWLAALKPHERVEALNNLAWMLSTSPDSTLRNGREAVELATQACQLTQYRFPVLIGTLAAAYAESGDFDSAIRTGTVARDLALEQGAKELGQKNDQLLAIYKSGKPFREAQ